MRAKLQEQIDQLTKDREDISRTALLQIGRIDFAVDMLRLLLREDDIPTNTTTCVDCAPVEFPEGFTITIT